MRPSSDRFAKREPIKKLSIIVAAFNEAPTLVQALDSLLKVTTRLPFPVEVLVVESNSTDGTRELLVGYAKDHPIKAIYQERPMGKGSAVREGLRQISGDVFLIYDADNEYSATDLPKLLVPIEAGQTSFVLGTRHEKGRPMRVMEEHRFKPALMNSAHKFFTYLINLFFQVRLTDPFTMYKIFRAEVFQGVKLVSNRFDFDWELVAKAIRRGSNPIEIPVTYDSRSFSEGKKVRLIRDPLSWFVALIRFRFERLETE